MTSLKTIIMASILAFLAIAPGVTAAPYSSPEDAGDVRVYIRDDDGAFHHTPEMAHAIVVRSAASPYEKRSHAYVEACFASDCTNCREVFNRNFSSNSNCINVENTRCLIVSGMDNANIKYWNRANCNGNISKFSDCSGGRHGVSAPGTNSIGLHVGC
jgi:hypothetical protein